MSEERIIGFDGFQPQQQQPSTPLPQQVPPQESFAPVKMSKEEIRKFKFLLYEEQAAVEAAQKANKKRENYCLQLEKKYGLTGHKWTVDMEKSIILPATSKQS
jgi:hypothetical protein